MAGHRMAELAIRPAMVEVLDTLHRAELGIGVEEMVVNQASAVVGKTIEASGLLAPTAARVLALRRQDGTLHVNPGATMRLEEGDLVIALGSEEQLFASASALK
jgi:K+/H+ antiporter YhaU regulatory subunit KhtT